jgi:hypothetical protein
MDGEILATSAAEHIQSWPEYLWQEDIETRRLMTEKLKRHCISSWSLAKSIEPKRLSQPVAPSRPLRAETARAPGESCAARSRDRWRSVRGLREGGWWTRIRSWRALNWSS